MNLPWFKRIGIFYIPITIIGWLMFLAGIACSVYVFLQVDSKSHSVSDTLINFVFDLLIIGAFYSLLAYMTSRTSKKRM